MFDRESLSIGSQGSTINLMQGREYKMATEASHAVLFLPLL